MNTHVYTFTSTEWIKKSLCKLYFNSMIFAPISHTVILADIGPLSFSEPEKPI